MRLHEATKRETIHIAVGVGALSLVMNLVLLALNKWDLTVLWGTLGGGGFAVLNFLLLGLSVQKATAYGDERKAKQMMQFSYSLRMLATAIWLILATTLSCFYWLAGALPLLFPRVTIAVMQLAGKYHPNPAQGKGEE